jgi:hypothetical protein
MLGTDLHFTFPHNEPFEDPTYLQHGKDYDLIAANSIKIVGRNAHLISASSSTAPGRRAAGTKVKEPATSLQQQQQPTTKRTSNQTGFVQRLMEAKRTRGETDMVRTAYSIRRGQNFEDRLRGWARTEERLARIHRLNREAMDGNPNAIRELEEIYAEVEVAAINAHVAQTQSTAAAGASASASASTSTEILLRTSPDQAPSGTRIETGRYHTI